MYFARCVREEINIKVIGLFTIGISAQLAIWIIFLIITITMVKTSHTAIISQRNSTRMKELQKNFRVLFTLSILFGLPWIFVLVAHFIQSLPNIGSIVLFIAGIVDYSQGPLLFLVQGPRLTEVRQLWKRWLRCGCHTDSQKMTIQLSLSSLDKRSNYQL